MTSAALDFLSPDTATAFRGEAPPLRSTIEWTHREAGAELVERAGWQAVQSYGAAEREAAACRRSVGIADVSYLGKLELQGAAQVVGALVAELAGSAPEPGRALLADDVWWCPVSAGRVLAITTPEATGRVREQLAARAESAEGFVAINELTTSYGSNLVVGPLARETFARTTALDLRPQRFAERDFAPVSVARTPGMVLRESGDRFLHLFGAGYAHYIWTVFVDAAEALGGRRVGAAALRVAAGEEAARA
jgi:glycine cleavage system aminomethyltransferase T